MEENKKKGFFSINAHNLKLWIMLAAIPVGVVAFMYIFGTHFIDDSAYREDDEALSSVKEEHITIKDEKPDIKTHETGTLALTETEQVVPKAKATTKKDKRMVAANGSLEMITLEEGQTLRTLAKKRFGNSHFWVYFHDVNRDQLNHPDDLKVGMKLYVPNPEYFNISANDSESIEAAKKRATEVLNSFAK